MTEPATGSTTEPTAAPRGRTVELLPGGAGDVGGIPVHRLLPRRVRRTVGAWCFVDQIGPVDAAATPMQVGPHPHIGLHTVTWLLRGEVLHRDSLGNEQLIRPGQLNLMTAGNGIAHAEETPERIAGALQAVQLWVAQPAHTRHGEPAFEHHPVLPQVALAGADATVLAGTFAGARSPARTDTALVGADLLLHGRATVPLDPTFEHAAVLLDGEASLDGVPLPPATLAYLAPGRSEVRLDPGTTARVLLIGGVPFTEQLAMFWNFVARTTEELASAYQDWQQRDGRFGDVASPLGRIAAPRPHWLSLR